MSGRALIRLVNLFVHWLYTGKFPELQDNDKWEVATQKEFWPFDVEARRLLAIKAYVFADRFIVSTFRRTLSARATTPILDALKDVRQIIFEETSPLVNYAFTHVPADRPLLQFLVDDFCCRWQEDLDLAEEMDLLKELHSAFLLRVMRVTRRFSEILRERGEAKTKCCYLEHASDKKEKAFKAQHMVYNEEREYGYLE